VYEHEEIGQNFRLPELLGAVGLAACENLPVMIANKRRIHDWYLSRLSDVPCLSFQQPKPGDRPVWWLNSLKFDPALLPADVQSGLQAKLAQDKSFNLAETIGMSLMKASPHIEIRPAFFPLHKMACFAQSAEPCPNANEVYDTLLCVPSSAQLLEEDVDQVCTALKQTLQEVMAGLVQAA
jgi:perosamine synthetase